MRSAWRTLKRTVSEFKEANLSDWAAALTYYGLLSLFPALIALVSIIGPVGDPETTTEKITEVITELGPESAAETFSGPIDRSPRIEARPASSSSSAWRWRSGRPPATSAPSSAPPTSSTRPRRAARSGSCARSSSGSPW